MHKFIKLFFISIFMAVAGSQAFAQDEFQPIDPSQAYKDTENIVAAFTKKMNLELKLEDWQLFLVDSVANANFFGKTEEMLDMNSRMISSSTLYQLASDKWDEKTYQAMHKILTEDQWKRYLKLGGERDKRQRDKRLEKK